MASRTSQRFVREPLEPIQPIVEGRVPPQAIDIEAQVLGAMLYERDAIGTVIEILDEDAFHADYHRKIYQAMCRLFRDNKPVDLITTAEELRKYGHLEVVGGETYLAELTTKITSAANVEYHAKIVLEKSMLRQTITSLSAIARRAYSPTEDVFDLLDEAEKSIFKIQERKKSIKQPEPIDRLCHNMMDIMERLNSGDQKMLGIPTGFRVLDTWTLGMEKGDLWVIAGRPSMGKAQPLYSRVRTIGGWKTMGEINVGDELASIDGTKNYVRHVWDRGELPIYRVTFIDGRTVDCAGDHLWEVVCSRWSKKEQVITTTELAAHLKVSRNAGRIGIPLLTSEEKWMRLPIDPYVLGVLLGDGDFCGSTPRITSADKDLIDRVRQKLNPAYEVRKLSTKYGYSIRQKKMKKHRQNKYTLALKKLKLHGTTSSEKFIPQIYKNGSSSQRRELLKGLIDTDGTVEKDGAIRFYSVSKTLATDFISIANSLGARCSIHEKETRLKGIKFMSYVVCVMSNHQEQFVELSRKKNRLPTNHKYAGQRKLNVVSVEKISSGKCKCITVSHPRGLYFTDNYVPTHNSAFVNCIEMFVSQEHGVLTFTPEMTETQKVMRYTSLVGHIDHHTLRKGKYSKNDWETSVNALGKLSQRKLWIDDTGSLGLPELKSKIIRYKAKHDIRLVVVDYLQKMKLPPSNEMHQEESLGQITGDLKALSKELGITTIVLSQFSRETEKAEGKRPNMGHLRGSGRIEQDADVILMLYRPEKYHMKTYNGRDTQGLAIVILEKQRNGTTGDIEMQFNGKQMRFEDFPPPEGYQGEETPF